MATIRNDLVGVVYVVVDHNRTALRAGDTVPGGVEIGDHLLAADTAATETADEPARRTPARKAAAAAPRKTRNSGR